MNGHAEFAGLEIVGLEFDVPNGGICWTWNSVQVITLTVIMS